MFRYERMRRACAAMLAALLLAGSGLLAPSARADTDGVLRVKLTRLGAPASVTLTAECALIPSLEGAEEIRPERTRGDSRFDFGFTLVPTKAMRLKKAIQHAF